MCQTKNLSPQKPSLIIGMLINKAKCEQPSQHVAAMLINNQQHQAHGKEIANPTMIPYLCI